MTPGDHAPTATPTLYQQRDALRQGLGRAAQWATAGSLGEGVLLAACLTDQRFDHQVDAGRADWLWGMVTVMGAAGRFREPLLDALRETPDGRSAHQLCGLAGHYAVSGDGEFCTQLYDIVRRKPVADSPSLGEDELLALDGEAGFLFAAGVRGRIVLDDPDASDDGDLIWAAGKYFGEDRVAELLATTDDDGVRRFRENLDTRRARRVRTSALPTVGKKLAATTADDILREATGGGGQYLSRRWGRQAKPADLRKVLSQIWDTPEPKPLANLLAVFSDRALPEFDARLLDLARHADGQVRRKAFDALGQNAHPRVRAFALDELAKGVTDSAVFGLFARNFECGDEQRLLDALSLPDDADDRHTALMSLLEVADLNPAADASQLGLTVYALTPCGHCRCAAATLLHQRGVAPDWLREECRHDADPQCRELAGRSC